MKTILLSFTCLGLISISPPLAFAEGTEIGVNTAVKGNVTIKTGEQEALRAIVAEPVLLDDLVNSPRLGTLQVLLADGTTFTVGPDCVLKIDRFVYDPDNKEKNELKASLTKGMFRFMSGNISKANSRKVSIDTPVASLGVRGTIVEGFVGDEITDLLRKADILPDPNMPTDSGASLFVLRGPGQNSNSKHRKGEIRITSGGQSVTVKDTDMAVFVGRSGAAPIGPFKLPENLDAKFDAKLRSAPTGGPSFRPFDFDMQDFDNPQRERVIRTSGEGAVRDIDSNRSGRSEVSDLLESNQSATGSDNPTSDLDWPTIYEDQQGNPLSCNPNNPHFPNC